MTFQKRDSHFMFHAKKKPKRKKPKQNNQKNTHENSSYGILFVVITYLDVLKVKTVHIGRERSLCFTQYVCKNFKTL